MNIQFTGMTNIVYFKAPLTANFELETLGATPSDTIKSEYTALVAVEGEFEDSKSNKHSFTPERFETIVAHTNRAIDSGTVVPVCADHQKDTKNVLGSIDGKAFTKIVTAEDLPNPKSAHLIGKVGLFLSGVKVIAQKGIDSLKSGIKSVSMGLNLDPNEHRIMELSLVPIPAIPNMGLFSKAFIKNFLVAKFGIPSIDAAITWEEMEATNKSVDALQEEYQDLCNKLWILLQNVYTKEDLEIDSPDTLLKIIYTLLNGFSMKVIDMLGLTDIMNQMNGMAEASGQQMTPGMQKADAAVATQDMAAGGQVTGQRNYKRNSVHQANFGCSGKRRFTRVRR